jgi:general secretion pathway protein H
MTLFEMLVVLAIIGSISAISAVNIDRAIGIYSLREAQSGVAASLKMARARALRFGEPVVFAVSGDGKAFGMSDGPLAELPGGVVMQQPPNGGIAFYPDGTSPGGQLTLSNARGRVALSVDEATGVVATVQP